MRIASLKMNYVLAALLFSSLAHAQLTAEQMAEIREGYKTDSTADLSIETGRLTVSASWHCGVAVAKRIASDIQNERPINLANLSPACQVDAIKLKLATNEIATRTKKELQKRDVIETPIENFNFSIAFGQLTPISKLETTGSGFCLEKARARLAYWEQNENFDGPWASMKSNTVIPCQVSREGDESVGSFVCREWSMGSLYDFTTGEIKLIGASRKHVTPQEQARLDKMVRHNKAGEPNYEDIIKWLKADLEAGLHIVPMLRMNKGATTGILEIRGVAGPEWQKSVLSRSGQNRVGRSDVSTLPALCSVKTEIKATATDIRAGRIF